MAYRMGKMKAPVLVTGAAGFIGRHLINRLIDDGLSVLATDILACPEALASEPLVTWVSVDITDTRSIRTLAASCGTLFHMAAVVGDWGSEDLHRRITVEGTRHVFEAAAQAKTPPRVVLASSIVVYGHQINGTPCHEAMLFGDAMGPYSRSKQAQESLVRQYLQRGLDIRIVRPANVYGAGSKPWVENLCAELKRGVPALVAGGDYNAGLVHVDNVVEVLLRAASASGARGQIFNAADEEGVTWKRYMTDLADACGAPKPRSIPRVAAHYLAYASEKVYRLLKKAERPPLTLEALNLVGSDHHIDMTKTRLELNYKPVRSYQDGIAEIQNYLKS